MSAGLRLCHLQPIVKTTRFIFRVGHQLTLQHVSDFIDSVKYLITVAWPNLGNGNHRVVLMFCSPENLILTYLEILDILGTQDFTWQHGLGRQRQ